MAHLLRRPSPTMVVRAAFLLACLAPLGGCGLVALPFRVTGDVIRIVPVVGDPVAAPFDAVGDAID